MCLTSVHTTHRVSLRTIADFERSKTSKVTKNIGITPVSLWISHQKLFLRFCQSVQVYFFIFLSLIRPQKSAAGRPGGAFCLNYFFNPSRISRSSFTSSDGSAGFSSSAGSSSSLLSLLIALTTKKITNATIRKSMIDCRNTP